MGEGWRQGNICCLPTYYLDKTRYAWKSLQKLLKSDFKLALQEKAKVLNIRLLLNTQLGIFAQFLLLNLRDPRPVKTLSWTFQQGL